MPRELQQHIPDAETLLSLHPEELAGILLQMFSKRTGNLHAYNFVNDLYQMEEIYPRQYRDRIGQAIMEAWGWLEREGLIAAAPRDMSRSTCFVTRKGHEVAQENDFEAYRKASAIPRAILHPTIADKCWSNFLKGDYETAIFQAFKEVEVAVRKAGGFDNKQIGVSLMRQAFDKTSGPLTDMNLIEGEREAMQHLFAGAIGSYKNPASHRTVALTNPNEAAEMLILASHLLRVVDGRATKTTP